MKYILKLYVNGKNIKSLKAIKNLEKIIRESSPDEYELELVDVTEFPELAESAGILETPALTKNLPPPYRKIIGDLANSKQVLFGLGMELFDSGSEQGS